MVQSLLSGTFNFNNSTSCQRKHCTLYFSWFSLSALCSIQTIGSKPECIVGLKAITPFGRQMENRSLCLSWYTGWHGTPSGRLGSDFPSLVHRRYSASLCLKGVWAGALYEWVAYQNTTIKARIALPCSPSHYRPPHRKHSGVKHARLLRHTAPLEGCMPFAYDILVI